MCKIFTLKTTILLREIKEDLNKWNVITFMNWKTQHW